MNLFKNAIQAAKSEHIARKLKETHHEGIFASLSFEELVEAVRLAKEAKKHLCSIKTYYLKYCSFEEQIVILSICGFKGFERYSRDEFNKSKESAAYVIDNAFAPIKSIIESEFPEDFSDEIEVISEAELIEC